MAKAATALAPAIDVGCALVDFRVLAAQGGADIETLAGECAAHGVAELTTLGGYAQCLLRQHQCLVDDLLLLEAPRAADLLGLVGRSLDASCPAP